jgi:uncharacterized protein Yka (UPF0111/DUF47 family)
VEGGIRFDVYHHIDLADGGPDLAAMLKQMEDRIMSELSDRITAVDASVDGMIARVQKDIAQLQDMVAAGAATPEIMSALDAIKAKLDGFAPTVMPTAPTTTGPATIPPATAP